ncbi:MAG: hypothetical protein WBA00_10980 [Rhodococcus sp. (in: high G+C Gram-positive bacteria)]
MSTSRDRGLRGSAVGALTAALAVAAHGVGGGGLPTSTSLTLLSAVAVGVGVLAGGVATDAVGRRPLMLWLAGGQVAAHTALSVTSAHLHAVGSDMLAAHAVAIGLGAVLVSSVEHLFGVITSVLRSPVRPFAPLARRSSIAATAPLGLPTPVPAMSAVSRRGPPSVHTPRQ